jgi:antitoxin MazE
MTRTRNFAAHFEGAIGLLLSRARFLQIARVRSYNVITVAARTRIVRIGNSRGIRIPKTLLDQAELPEEVELHAEPGRLVVEAGRQARRGWAAAARRMRARGEGRLLDGPTRTRFDVEEWEWR